MSGRLDALKSSSERLRAIAEALHGDQLTAPSYASEWNIADVFSHLGSGAVLMLARVEAGVAGTEIAADVAPPVWDEWNAKSPEAKARDALVADRALVDRFDAFTAPGRAAFHITFGPMQLDFDGLVGLRLNEHAVHTWDIAVMLDPTATVPADAAALILDSLGLIAGFVGKPSGTERALHVRTTGPTRDFELVLGAERVSLEPCAADHTADLELPAEAFVRLVYGRLDPDHTPPVRGAADLDELRRAFPGP